MKHSARLLLASVAVVFSGMSAAQAGLEPPEPDEPHVEIVDNLLDPGKVTSNGKWSESSAPVEWEKSSVFSNEKAATFTFRPDLRRAEPTVVELEPHGGALRRDEYLVEVFWSYHPNRSDQVPYCIEADAEEPNDLNNFVNGDNCVTFNQRDSKAGGQWVEMGTYSCSESTCAVTVYASNGQASADAVRWTHIKPPPPPPPWPMADCPCDEYYSRAVDKYLGWGGRMVPHTYGVCTRAIQPITAASYQTPFQTQQGPRTLNLILAANIGLDGNTVPPTNGFGDDNGGMNGENGVIYGSCFAATVVGDPQRRNAEELAESRRIDFLIYTRGKRHLTPDQVRACKRSVRDFCIQDPDLVQTDPE